MCRKYCYFVPGISSKHRGSRSFRRWGLQGSNANVIFCMTGHFGARRWLCFVWHKRKGCSVAIACVSNMVATLATKKLGSSAKQTPWVLIKMRHTLNFINLGKSAKINIEEWYNTSLYGLPIFWSDGWGVSVRGG